MNGYALKNDLHMSRFNSSLYISNCNVVDFAEFAKCGFNSTLRVESCHISDCSQNGIE
jgi:hypothetical protein